MMIHVHSDILGIFKLVILSNTNVAAVGLTTELKND